MSWNGRELTQYRTFTDDGEGTVSYGTTISYTYNADGIRTSKTVNGVKHEYYLSGSQIMAETWVENGVEHTLIYLYDESGSPIGLKYRNSGYGYEQFETFFFEKNLQGDVIAIYNANGVRIGSYLYDAWGNFTVTLTDTNTLFENTIVNLYNPFRYRGYYYDVETGFYYLQSRYYNPEWGRFLNVDAVIAGTSGTLYGYNLYAYCFNNPIMMTDSQGNWPDWRKSIRVIKNIVEDISNLDINNTSEAKALESNYFSVYKRKLVIRLPIGKNAFSFGALFIGSDVSKNSYDKVKHEYGHTVQLEKMGVFRYLKDVGIPSVTGFLKGEELPYDYYTAPWEAEADMYGGVTGRISKKRDWTPEDGYYNLRDLIYELFH